MQTYTQSLGPLETWTLNIPGKFMTVLNSANAVNLRFFKNGKMLDLGEIKGISAGIEVGGMVEGVEFDRVEVESTAADTITIGIGNGQSRYNRGAASVTVIQNKVAQATFAATGKTVTSSSGALVAANANRQFLAIQNKDATGIVYVTFGNIANPFNGYKIGPGEALQLDGCVPTNSVNAIGSIASNSNVMVIEG